MYSKLASNTLKPPRNLNDFRFLPCKSEPKHPTISYSNSQLLARSKRLRPTHSVSATFTESVGVRKPQPGAEEPFLKVQQPTNLEGHVQICVSEVGFLGSLGSWDFQCLKIVVLLRCHCLVFAKLCLACPCNVCPLCTQVNPLQNLKLITPSTLLFWFRHQAGPMTAATCPLLRSLVSIAWRSLFGGSAVLKAF